MARKVLIALGGAEGVWDECREARELAPDADMGACNESGADLGGRLTLWATLHPEKLHAWQRRRKHKGGNEDYLAVSHKLHANTRIDRVCPEIFPGTSGLFVCRVAIMELGYTHVICCGMPLDESPHYFDDKAFHAAKNYKRGWKEALQSQEMRGRIKSMSGWTRDLVGYPTKEWLSVTATQNTRGGAPFTSPQSGGLGGTKPILFT